MNGYAEFQTTDDNAVVMVNGLAVWLSAAVALMDDEIRERLHGEMAPCDAQEFVSAYCSAHIDKFGEEFSVS